MRNKFFHFHFHQKREEFSCAHACFRNQRIGACISILQKADYSALIFRKFQAGLLSFICNIMGINNFMIKDALGRKWQLGTIQVDYNLPERFGLEYIGADDKRHRPVMIHRAPFGSMERFCAVLIEHTAGKFPLWLTPEQVVVLPISEKYNEYAQKVSNQLNISDIRAGIDDRNEKIGRKIRDNEIKRIPYLLIVGEKEFEGNTVAVRRQGEGDKGSMSIDEFAEFINKEVSEQLADAWK